MPTCSCSPRCDCLAHGDGCRCQRRLCPVLCQCTPKCLPACDCLVPCVILEDDELQQVERERNLHIEVLTADGMMRDADTRAGAEADDGVQVLVPCWANVGAKLRSQSPIFAFLWEYRVNQSMSNVQVAELLGLSEGTVRALMSTAIREILHMADLSPTAKRTIVRCLRSGRQGGPRPERQQAKGKRLLLP